MKQRLVSPEECPLFSDFSVEERQLLLERFEQIRVPEGVEVVKESEPSDAVYVVLAGEAQICRGKLVMGVVEPGEAFGELGLASGAPRTATVKAATELVLARLSRENLDQLFVDHARLAEAFLRNVVRHLRTILNELSDTVALLIQERARPLRTQVEARLPGGETRPFAAATPLAQILPAEINGEPVVAALVDRKERALSSPLYSSAQVEPVTMRHPEGRAAYRRSVGLLLVEAGRRLNPPVDLRIGPSLGFAHLVELVGEKPSDLIGLAASLERAMRALVAENLPLRRQRFTVEEARTQFEAQGWKDAVRLLRIWRSSTVPLVSLNDLFAIEIGPTTPSTGYLEHFEVFAHGHDLVLTFGDNEPHTLTRTDNPGSLARQHETWLKTLGVDSVGAFNDLCINGEVSQIIRVSEGFHEKSISQIADQILARGNQVKVVCVSGPSSSGKTTFLKRLSVQLQVNGIQPLGLSLDDYYVDRELTVRDEHGDYDFEAFEALNIPLLGQHLTRLLAGETVRTAHYDFKTGKSHPEGGQKLTLGDHNVLMAEGIHALNPALPVGDKVFRIFINPMTALPLDHVNRVSVSDIRLLRRIVRDRHQRAITAADNIMRWGSVRTGERRHIFPNQFRADAEFNSALLYEPAVLKVFAERYLLEVPDDHPAHVTAHRLRRLLDRFVAIYPDHVGPTSLLREFIGGLSF